MIDHAEYLKDESRLSGAAEAVRGESGTRIFC